MLRVLPVRMENNLHQSSDNFVDAFNKIMNNDRNLPQITYITFLGSLGKKGRFNPYHQQDVHEAMTCMSNALSQSINNTCFEFKIESKVLCKRCLTDNEPTVEHCKFLQLSLCDFSEDTDRHSLSSAAQKPPIEVQSCIQNFFVSKSLSGENAYQCDTCAKKTEAGKEIEMDNPKILFIHLLRFTTNEQGVVTKDNRRVIVNSGTILINNLAYTLKAAICHSGEYLNGGHYIAYVNSNDAWYKCNDNEVSMSKVEDINESEIYILSYEKNIS